MSTDKVEVESLRSEIRNKLAELKDSYFTEQQSISPVKTPSLLVSRTLQGHFQKVYAIDWAGNNSNEIMSASQDGKIIIWNADTQMKSNAITLTSCWVMACAFEKSSNGVVASGGLNNICSIYRLRDNQIGIKASPDYDLEGHEGYISSCKFINSQKLVTSSGDGQCKVWDVENSTCTHYYNEHGNDVMSVDVCPTDENLFVSGGVSVNGACMLWDIRMKSNAATFRQPDKKKKFMYGFYDEESVGEEVGGKMIYQRHDSDVNSVKFFPDGNSFASGSDDASCKLWDLRSHQEINNFQNATVLCGVTSIAFSKSGRITFAAYDDNSLLAWDTLDPKPDNTLDRNTEPLMFIRSHSAKVSHVSVHSAGKAVATASWDTLIRVYA